jgi:hypothetical protein
MEEEQRRNDALGAADPDLGTDILESIDGQPITNPFLIVKAQELRSIMNNKDKTYLEKKKFVEGESTLAQLEKKKYITQRKAPKRSSIPVITAHLEVEVVNLQNPPELVIVPLPVP